MNTSFWSHCQGLVLRLKYGRVAARPRRRWQALGAVQSLEIRALLSTTPAMVADINPGPASSSPTRLLAIGSTTYFTAYDGVHGYELWKSDGTALGSVLVKDINPGANSSYASNLTDVNGTLFFTVADGIHGNELWKSNGTAAGTVMVADINPLGSSYPSSLVNVNGTLFFAADDSVNGRELWTSNGTVGGTTIVADIAPGSTIGYYGGLYPNSSSPQSLINLNGTLFFTATDGVNGYALWKSNGTDVGTVMVAPVAASGAGFTNVNGTLFFSAYDSVNGQELWKSDGTTDGTTIVKDIFPGTYTYSGYYAYWTGPNSSNPSNLTNVNGTLFFTAYDDTHGAELWRSDGSPDGTTIVADINPDGASSSPNSLINVNGTLFFSAFDGTHGYELWRSNGTSGNTTMVADINPGSGGSGPAGLTNINGTVFFSAVDAGDGRELWKSDGTAPGTVMLADINPGSASSYPSNLTNANGILFFAANDGVHGAELWAHRTVPVPILAVSGFPATTTAGVAGSFTVVAKNADGTTNTSYTGTVHFTSTDPLAVLPADYTFIAGDHGTHVFSANLKTAGYRSLTAADTQAPVNSGTEWSILVKSAAASTVNVSGFPAITTAGDVRNFTVTLFDPFGNIATGYLGTVHFSSSDAKAVLPANYVFTAADAGQRTFSATLKTAGIRSITAADTVKASLIGTEGNITVSAAAASQFLISVSPRVKPGVPFSLTLTVKDAYGNVATGYRGTVHFTSKDRKALLPADYPFTAVDNGVHTFPGLILRKRGTQKVTITDTLNSSLTTARTRGGR